VKDWHLGRPLSEVVVGDIVSMPNNSGSAARVRTVGKATAPIGHIQIEPEGYPHIVGPPNMKVDIYR
jgi:hypothetical protein